VLAETAAHLAAVVAAAGPARRVVVALVVSVAPPRSS
jgi:hypothetical protein